MLQAVTLGRPPGMSESHVDSIAPVFGNPESPEQTSGSPRCLCPDLSPIILYRSVLQAQMDDGVSRRSSQRRIRF